MPNNAIRSMRSKDREHVEAQSMGKQKWYSWYKVDVAKVERSYQYSHNT